MTACPKSNPRYPDTSTRLEVPFGVIVRRADPAFDRERRFDEAYRFGRKRFVEDALLHGAYLAPVALASDPLLTRGAQDGLPSQATSSAKAALLAALDAQFRSDNGFCDPLDNGTVQTGTGAGGRNPGTIPSLPALVTPDGFVIVTPDGKAIDDGVTVGIVIGPAS